MLVTYQFGVRYTPIGWLLNGHRSRRAGGIDQASADGDVEALQAS